MHAMRGSWRLPASGSLISSSPWRADIAAGRLTEVLPKSAIEVPGLFLYYPRRASMAPKLKAFIDTTNDVLHQSRRFVSASLPENLKNTGHAMESGPPKKDSQFPARSVQHCTNYRLQPWFPASVAGDVFAAGEEAVSSIIRSRGRARRYPSNSELAPWISS